MVSIETWTEPQVLALPDHLLGQRVIHLLEIVSAGPSDDFLLDHRVLPDPCIVWGVGFWTVGLTGANCAIGVSLGVEMPGTLAAFAQLESVVGGTSTGVARLYFVNVNDSNGLVWMPCRRLLVTGGRRLVGYVGTLAGAAGAGHIAVEVSPLPRQIPDWFAAAAM